MSLFCVKIWKSHWQFRMIHYYWQSPKNIWDSMILSIIQYSSIHQVRYFCFGLACLPECTLEKIIFLKVQWECDPHCCNTVGKCPLSLRFPPIAPKSNCVSEMWCVLKDAVYRRCWFRMYPLELWLYMYILLL